MPDGALAVVGFFRLYSGVHWLAEVLAGRPLAAAFTVLFASLRLIGPAPRDRASPSTAATERPGSIYSGMSAGSRWVAGGHDESVRR